MGGWGSDRTTPPVLFILGMYLYDTEFPFIFLILRVGVSKKYKKKLNVSQLIQ